MGPYYPFEDTLNVCQTHCAHWRLALYRFECALDDIFRLETSNTVSYYLAFDQQDESIHVYQVIKYHIQYFKPHLGKGKVKMSEIPSSSCIEQY